MDTLRSRIVHDVRMTLDIEFFTLDRSVNLKLSKTLDGGCT